MKNDTDLKKNLSVKQYALLSSMLFGLFFGAGNLIFPIILGAKAGCRLLPAILGMLVTAVGIPLLGIISMGVSKSEGLLEMSGRVAKPYSYFFTCALYLTIGPFFAIPRCAATSFTMGISPLAGEHKTLACWIFTALFFAAVLFFSLRPSKIMESVGRWLNPIFLVFLGVLTVAALCNPVQNVSSVPATGNYQANAFTEGFLQGYDTLDALASLAFGIIVIRSIRSFGIEEPKAIAVNTVKAGVFSMSFMALIYALIALVGAGCYGLYSDRLSDSGFTGGDIFAIVAEHYFGKVGLVLIALIVTFCCLKTAIGLVTSCSQTFSEIFPHTLGYRGYAILFSVFSFFVSNVGLSKIITFSAPVLYFLYPLAIVLILSSIFGRYFGHDRRVYLCIVGFTMISAVLDLLRVSGIAGLDGFVAWVGNWLPLYRLGLGWLLPALIGTAVGLCLHIFKKKEKPSL